MSLISYYMLNLFRKEIQRGMKDRSKRTQMDKKTRKKLKFPTK